MFEKSPNGSVVVCNASGFKPDSIVTKKEDLLKNLKFLLQYSVKFKAFSASHADKASIQYREFLKNDMKLVKKDDDDVGCLDTEPQSWMLERIIQNSPKLILSLSLLVMDKLILGKSFPKIKLYCKKITRRTPIQRPHVGNENFNLILLRLQMK